MSVTPRVGSAASREEESPPSEPKNTELDMETYQLARRFWLSRWLYARGLGIERQLLLVQWALPLVLTGIVFAYEMGEHLIKKGEGVSSPDFIGELFFFGVLGPVAVWLVLWWIREEWQQRERDKHALQQMYNELAATQKRLNNLHAQRGELLNRLMSVQEEERRRVAREIHDELGQLLTGLSLNLKLCQEAVPKELEVAHNHLAKANALVRHTIEQAHRIIADLRPTVLDDYGLVPALREELNQRLAPLGIDAHLDTEGDLEQLPAEVATAAFRIVQEAITNIIRHANARHVYVRLHQTTEGLGVTVEDDGIGLPRKGLYSSDGRKGLGILGMRERARALGGGLEVTPREPCGTQVRLWLPLQRKEP